MDLDWNFMLVDQLDWLWRNQTRPRLAGLSDDEYFAEPVPGCWSVRPKGTSTAPIAVGGGGYVLEFAIPTPEPPPVATLAWWLAHVIVGVFGARVAWHFAGPPVPWDTFDYAGTADGALAQLDAGCAAGTADGALAQLDAGSAAGTADGALAQLDAGSAAGTGGVRGLGTGGLARRCGPAGGPWAEASLADLILHVNKEVIHHLAEVCLLRDLYRAQG